MIRIASFPFAFLGPRAPKKASSRGGGGGGAKRAEVRASCRPHREQHYSKQCDSIVAEPIGASEVGLSREQTVLAPQVLRVLRVHSQAKPFWRSFERLKHKHNLAKAASEVERSQWATGGRSKWPTSKHWQRRAPPLLSSPLGRTLVSLATTSGRRKAAGRLAGWLAG